MGDVGIVAGGFAKIAKLAGGALDLHSGRSQIDRAALAGMLAELGADATLIDHAAAANTASEILADATAAGLGLADHVAAAARARARALVEDNVAIEVAIFDRAGALVGRAGFQEP